MNRPIKFRGRNGYGEVFYGSFDEDTCTIDCWDVAETVVVERDTVAQLVGYDKDGKEVYEGDKVQLVVEHGIATVYTAELHAAGRDSAALCHYNFKDTRLLTEATK